MGGGVIGMGGGVTANCRNSNCNIHMKQTYTHTDIYLIHSYTHTDISLIHSYTHTDIYLIHSFTKYHTQTVLELARNTQI